MNNEFDLENVQQTGNFSITPYTGPFMDNEWKKITVDSGTKMQISNLVHQIPSALVSHTLASGNMYCVKFPDGLPHCLTQLKQGGFGSMIQNPDNGKFVGTASFYQVDPTQAIALATFSAMSIATGQYFLAEINKRLTIINQRIDKILEFLYGDKRAELMSEISFTQYAYQNFSSIMQYEEQRMATIANLQAARKVAMKDIEFYLNDFNSETQLNDKSKSTAEEAVNKSFQIHDSIDLSLQLLITSALLEIYYSGNTVDSYLGNICDELSYYVDKCDKQVYKDWNLLRHQLAEAKDLINNKKNIADKVSLLKKIDTRLDQLEMTDYRFRFNDVFNAIKAIKDPVEYAIDENGSIYYRQLA